MKTLLILLSLSLCWSADLYQQPISHLEANSALTQILKEIQKSPQIQSKYTQKKSLQSLKRPITTSGDFSFSLKQGVLWKQTKPFPLTIGITPNSLYQVNPDGSQFQLEADKVPFLSQISGIFISLFQGDAQKIFENFDVFFLGDSQNWQLGLIPKNILIQKFFQKITIHGKKQINSIHLIESSQSSTLLEFTQHRVSP